VHAVLRIEMRLEELKAEVSRPAGTRPDAADRMGVDLSRLGARSKAGDVRVVVEVPRGSRAKFKYDPELLAFTYSRPLVLGVEYPYDWGFVPSTMASDGDPLDVRIEGWGGPKDAERVLGEADRAYANQNRKNPEAWPR
jgi:inorganic pyrophosphatase